MKYSELQKRIRIPIILIVILMTALLFVFNNWGSLPMINENYGIPFNEKRVELGLPIVEDYFVQRYKGDIGNQVWYTPDSIKISKLHTGKNYWVENGEIYLEIDYFRRYISKSKFERISKHYYFQSGSKTFKYEMIEEEELISKEISIVEGDSILSAWRAEYTH